MKSEQILAVDDAATLWSRPAAERAGRSLLVLLHGLGGVEEDLTPIFPLLPDTVVAAALRGVLPIGDRWGWFDYARQPISAFDAAVSAVLAWADRASPDSPFGVLGFSQGGAVALELVRVAPARIAYAGQVAGFLMPHRRTASTELRSLTPPVFSAHGDLDEVIPPEDVRDTSEWLHRYTRLSEHRYPDIGHEIAVPVLRDAAAFVAEHARETPPPNASPTS